MILAKLLNIFKNENSNTICVSLEDTLGNVDKVPKNRDDQNKHSIDVKPGQGFLMGFSLCFVDLQVILLFSLKPSFIVNDILF